MKICVAGTRGFPGVQGGVETHCEHLYPRLAELGCEVTVYRRKPYVQSGIRRWKGVRFVDLWCPRTKHTEAITHTTMATLSAAQAGADILHLHAVGPALCVPLARTLGLRVVVTSQGPDYAREKWGTGAKLMLRTGEMLAARYAHRMIVVSEHIRRMIQREYGTDAVVIPNGVRIPDRPEATDRIRRWGLEPDRYVFALGRFVPEKGFHDLLDAWEGVETDWKLALAGDADHPTGYSRGLKERATQMEGVVLTGFVKGQALAQLYAHSGLFVLPSYHEGLPLVLLEALSYGCSPIVADIPSIRSVPLPQERCFRPGDVRELRARLRTWIRRGTTEAQRRHNLRMLRERYDWDSIARRTLDVYREIRREPQRFGSVEPQQGDAYN